MGTEYWSANELINHTAVEVGLTPVQDPVASSDPAYRRLYYLLTSACKELLRMNKWQDLAKVHEFSTPSPNGDGSYDMPEDYGYMIPQTHWNETDSIPVFGPLTPQDWSYLKGRGLVSSTIYVSFRIRDGKFNIFPNDPEIAGKNLFFEYISRRWCDPYNNDAQPVGDGAATVLLPPLLVVKYLKVKYLEAKGYDSTKARDDFNDMIESFQSQDKSAPVLNTGGLGRTFPYLDGWWNVPDSGYGM